MYTHEACVIKLVCFSLFKLSFVTLIYGPQLENLGGERKKFAFSPYISHREHHKSVSMMWGERHRGISANEVGDVGDLATYSCNVCFLDQLGSDPGCNISVMCVFHAVTRSLLWNPRLLGVFIVTVFWGLAYGLSL